MHNFFFFFFFFLLPCRTTEQVLKLEDPNSLEDDMGVIVLNLSLAVKQGDFKRNVSGLGNQIYSWNL